LNERAKAKQPQTWTFPNDVSKTIMLWTRYSRPDEQNLKTIRADYENKSENIVPLKSIS